MFVWGLFILTLCAWLVTSEALAKAKAQHELTLQCHKKELDQLNDELREAKEKSLTVTNDVIYKLVEQVQNKGLYTNYKTSVLCDIILRNSKITDIIFDDELLDDNIEDDDEEYCLDINDVDFDHFENTIKTALYADKGYLTIHYPTDIDKPMYRLGKYGKHIPITAEECEKMNNKNYDFIFESIEVK